MPCMHPKTNFTHTMSLIVMGLSAASSFFFLPPLASANDLAVYGARGTELLYKSEVPSDKALETIKFKVESDKVGSLSGKKVVLLDKNNNYQVVKSATANKDVVEFSDIAPGAYQLSLADRCESVIIEKSIITLEEQLKNKGGSISSTVLKDIEEVQLLAENIGPTEATRKIELSLKDSSGKSAKKETVRLVRTADAKGNAKNEVVKTVTSDDKGLAVFRNIPAGSYRVEPASCYFLIATFAGASNTLVPGAAVASSGTAAAGAGTIAGVSQSAVALGVVGAAAVGGGAVAIHEATKGDPGDDRPAVSPS